MRHATRWILALLAMSFTVIAFAGQSGGKTNQPAAITPVRKATTTTAHLIARVKPSKPTNQMTLKELASFQERALRVYVSRWHTWKTNRSRLISDVARPLEECRGAYAPHWACWNLYASIWTRHELGETRGHLEAKQLLAMGANDWGTAVHYVQKVFPGTERWLLSCSRSEGGHGAWKPYHDYGSAWYPGYGYTSHRDAVGGPMQFRPSTFYGYVFSALAWARAHGLRLPQFGPEGNGLTRESVKAWLSPLAQAVTAGFMRSVLGNSHIHWAASIDAGCA